MTASTSPNTGTDATAGGCSPTIGPSGPDRLKPTRTGCCCSTSTRRTTRGRSARGPRGGHQVVPQVDGVAAGLPAFVEPVRMSPLGAWRDGIRRVAGAPLIIAGVWLMTTLVGLPLALVMRDDISRHFGASLAAETAASGVNYEWMQEFADQATGLGTTLKPTILGLRRRARQPERVSGQHGPAAHHRRRGGRVHRPLAVRGGRHHRSLRARSGDGRPGILCRVGRVLLPISQARDRDVRRLRAALRLRAPVAVRPDLSAPDSRGQRRTHGVSRPGRALSRLRTRPRRRATSCSTTPKSAP